MFVKKLTARQLGVIDDLVAAEMDEREILRKHRVTRRLFIKWLEDEVFVKRFRERIDFAKLQWEAMTAKCMSAAIRRLMGMTKSRHTENARTACIDIMNVLGGVATGAEKSEKKAKDKKASPKQVFSAETAQKVRAVLAEARREEAERG